MGEFADQFYRTWCYEGRNVRGSSGWGIRAKSASLTLQEAENLQERGNYWYPLKPSAPMGRRLALFRSDGGTLLAHGVPRTGLVGGRDKVSFEHILVRLPMDFSALDALKLWRSPDWRMDDGDYGTALDQILWKAARPGADFPAAQALGSAEGAHFPDGILASQFLAEPEVGRWAASVVSACGAILHGEKKKLYILGRDDTIAHLLFAAIYCLPECLRRRVTFSTHENPGMAPENIQIVGVTSLEQDSTDLPSHCFTPDYCALNLFRGTCSDNIHVTPFARLATEWLRTRSFAEMARVRSRFDQLDPEEHPGTAELNMLAEHASTGPQAWLSFTTSAGVFLSVIANSADASSLVEEALRDPALAKTLSTNLAAWLPGRPKTRQAFITALADVGRSKLLEDKVGAFDCLKKIATFASLCSKDPKRAYWKELLGVCSAPNMRPFPSLQTRLLTLGCWYDTEAGLKAAKDEDRFRDLAVAWLDARPPDRFETHLFQILESDIIVELKQEALRLLLCKGRDTLRRVLDVVRRDATRRDQFIRFWLDRTTGLPEALAEVVLFDMCSGGDFESVKWYADISEAVHHDLQEQFWSGLFDKCAVLTFTHAPKKSRPITWQDFSDQLEPQRAVELSSNAQLPPIDTRIGVLREWCRIPEQDRDFQAGLIKLRDCWLDVAAAELPKILTSELPFEWKEQRLKFCLTGKTRLHPQEAEAILICLNQRNNRHPSLTLFEFVFRERPGWGNILEALEKGSPWWKSFLEGYANEFIRQCYVVEDDHHAAVEWWSRNHREILPDRVRSHHVIGAYLRLPDGFRMESDRGDGKETPITTQWKGILDPTSESARQPKLASRGATSGDSELEDLRRTVIRKWLENGSFKSLGKALDWFGKGQWAASPFELIKMFCRNLGEVSLQFADPKLEQNLTIIRSLIDPEAAAEDHRTTLRSINLEDLVGFLMTYLPKRLWLPETKGVRVLEALRTDVYKMAERKCPNLDDAKEWVDTCYVLARAFQQDVIDPKDVRKVAKAYKELAGREDSNIRKQITKVLARRMSQQPESPFQVLDDTVPTISDPAKPELVKEFLIEFQSHITAIESGVHNGLLAKQYVLSLTSQAICTVEGVSWGLQETVIEDLLRRFARVLDKTSKSNVNAAVRGRERETRDLWYKASDHQQSWSEKARDRLEDFLKSLQELSTRQKSAIALGGLLIAFAIAWVAYPWLGAKLVGSYWHPHPYYTKVIRLWHQFRIRGIIPFSQPSTRSTTNMPSVTLTVLLEGKEPGVVDVQFATNALPYLLHMVEARDLYSGTNRNSLCRFLSSSPYQDRAIVGFERFVAESASAEEGLTKLLRDESPEVRICAMKCLGAIAPVVKNSYYQVRKLYFDPDRSVRIQATNTVMQMGGPVLKKGVPQRWQG